MRSNLKIDIGGEKMKITSKLILGALFLSAMGLADTAPTSQAVAAERLFFQSDMVRGRPKSGPTGPVCVLASQFKPGEMVVFRVRIFDPAKSNQLGKASLKSLIVELPDGKKITAHYRTHPPKHPTDTYWTAAWNIRNPARRRASA